MHFNSIKLDTFCSVALSCDHKDLTEYLIFFNPKFEKCKNMKSGLILMWKQEKLEDLFLVFPVRFER